MPDAGNTFKQKQSPGGPGVELKWEINNSRIGLLCSNDNLNVSFDLMGRSSEQKVEIYISPGRKLFTNCK